ncbi:MAG: hypothetical protein IIC29_07375 [Chloroflexi bacterium]|nr:hypothetical protein [Chloroflexota bacterium]
MLTPILRQAPIRSMVRMFAIASAGMVAAACGSSPTGTYFGATDPIFDRHSRTMADAEASMFEATSANDAGLFTFGGDTVIAARLLPIFRDTAWVVEKDISEWDAIDVPVVTSDYHSLVREAMYLRLDAMQKGVIALEALTTGNGAGEPLADAESAMAKANVILQKALDESDRIRG